MISLIISGKDYSGKIVDEPKENPVDLVDSANSFTSLANTRHRYVAAVKRKIGISLSALTEGEKSDLLLLIGGKNFSVTYNGASFTAFCESRSCSCYYSDNNENLYDVNLTIEEV